MLSLTTDYMTGLGSPEPYLRCIAAHNFSHVHWCHQWNTDFIYAEPEIDAIEGWMREYHLGLTDVHASDGVEKDWLSAVEYERLAGIELVINRMHFARRLGSDVIIMHMPTAPDDKAAAEIYWSRVRRTLDALKPETERYGVYLAIENGDPHNLASIAQVFEWYGPEFVGLCYDCGHGNLAGDGLEWLDKLGTRLLALHLHDNDGHSDQHKLPFTGTIDWDRLMRLIAKSTYRKWVSLELGAHHTGISDEDLLLDMAYAAAVRLQAMLDHYRAN
ncbi:MAG: sugar phosphate isomerase/epimerase family protein [Anaerolineae bacterium]